MIPEFTKTLLSLDYLDQNKQVEQYYRKKAAELNIWLERQKEKTDKYFEKAIQWWRINAHHNKIKWDDIIETILKEKVKYLRYKFDVPEHLVVDLFIEIAVTKFQLEQKNLSPKITYYNEHYLSLLVRFIDELPIKLRNENDELRKINIELSALNYQNEITIFKMMKNWTSKIKISKDDADKIHDQMISDYEKFIELLARKRGLIQTKLQTYSYHDPIDKIEDELTTIKLKWEIEAKKTYIKYFKERNLY